MQQLELPLTNEATTPEERRARGRDGRCQACDRPIDAEWLLLSFGWYCRDCEQGDNAHA